MHGTRYERQEACMETGLLHIYCGDGKGKSTAAAGLALRMAGCGGRVLFSRFLKTEHSGEVPLLRDVEGITVLPVPKSFGFFWNMTDEQKKEAARLYGEYWQQVEELCQSGSYDMLVVDEFMAAYKYGWIPNDRALSFLKNRPAHLEVVLTGRDPSKELLEMADYVSEIRKVKHPFDRGIASRKGIEY